jgi:hypothetical protein
VIVTDEKAISIFGQGEAASARGEYRADCPHEYGSDAWEMWMLGFEHEEGPRYRLKRGAQ